MSVKDPFTLANVMLSEKAIKDGMSGIGIDTQILADTVFDVAYAKPMWKFVAHYRNSGHPKVFSFTVVHEGEKLGTIQSVYYRRDYAVEVKNDRISNKRERGGGYRTSDPSKAVAAVKKMFSRQNIAERVEKADNVIRTSLNEHVWGKGREVKTLAADLEKELLTFVRKDADTQKAFAEHLVRTGQTHIQTKADHAAMEMQTVERIMRQYSEGKSTVVLLVDDKYVVKDGEDVMMFTVEGVPENIRGKLGMLKLIEDGAIITNVGCRVNSETFVIFNEEGAQA